MSTPPPGGWQPGPPPNQGQPYGQPEYIPQQPAPGWQQGNWPQQPGPPTPQKGSSLKWLLIGVAVLLVIGITVGATLLFTRDSGGGTTTSSSAAPSDIASANDTGPVAIITNEPTCNTFNGISNSLSDVESNGWGDARGNLGPAADWTSEQRFQVEAVATAMRNSAEQMIPLAKQTPHRLMRELYEQFIAYGRAYADSVKTYTPADDALASANVNIGATIFGICNAIETGASNRSISLQPGDPPTNEADPSDPSEPKRFITTADQTCRSWQQNSDDFDAKTAEWQKLDTDTPASQWTSERRALVESAMPFLSSWAKQMQTVGSQSGNAVLEDFASAGSLYMQAFMSVGDKYVASDSWLSYVGYKLNQTILAGCRAAEG